MDSWEGGWGLVWGQGGVNPSTGIKMISWRGEYHEMQNTLRCSIYNFCCKGEIIILTQSQSLASFILYKLFIEVKTIHFIFSNRHQMS